MEGISERNDMRISINPKLDLNILKSAYRGAKRLYIANVLRPEFAAALYEHLRSKVAWRTFLIADEHQYVSAPMEIPIDGSATSAEMLQLATSAASRGFVSIFDADHLLTDDEGVEDIEYVSDGVLASAYEFIASPEFLGFCRRITGILDIAAVEAQAVCYRPGHFVNFHGAAPVSEKARRRRAGFLLDLTPDWRAEWGALQAFRGEGGASIEAFQPCFNALQLFSLPQGHWLTHVAPFAEVPRYAISGGLYIEG